MNTVHGLSPAVVARLRGQRESARADVPTADMLEVIRLVRAAEAGDRAAEEMILDRLSIPGDTHLGALSAGLVRAWLKETGSEDTGDLCDRYAQLFNFDQTDEYRRHRDSDLVDACVGHAADLLVATLRSSTERPGRATLLSVLDRLFDPFCQVAGSSVGWPDGRYRKLRQWLAEIGFLIDEIDQSMGPLDLLITEAFTLIDFRGDLPSNRQQVMLGPCGAHIASRLVVDALETTNTWLRPGKHPKEISLQQATRFRDLVAEQLDR